ncbi:MAG: uL15 family ribosomal protein [Candidatus Pacearchaeota archaeon]
MKLKKRSARSRLRGRRTCGYGSRKKHRGKGSKGGKGMAGTGKRAGQKLTYVYRYYGKYLGRYGFKSRKKVKRRKISHISLEGIIYRFHDTKEKVINLDEYKILAGNLEVVKKLEGYFDKLKGKEVICASISKKAKEILENYGVNVKVKEENKNKIKKKE